MTPPLYLCIKPGAENNRCQTFPGARSPTIPHTQVQQIRRSHYIKKPIYSFSFFFSEKGFHAQFSVVQVIFYRPIENPKSNKKTRRTLYSPHFHRAPLWWELRSCNFPNGFLEGLVFPSTTLRGWPRKGLKPSCQTANSGTGPEGTWEPGQPSDKGRIVAAHWIGNDL